jgi:hypothetical protein
MLIKVTEIGDIETKREGKRRWKEIRLDYETAEKSENYKILLDWANPDAYAEAQDCEVDKFYEVTVKKNGKFWNWESITESDETEFSDKPKTHGYTKATESKGGTDWAAKNKLDADRFEFEKEKQGLIIRQSCIGYAIQFYAGKSPSYNEVINMAAQFEDNVLDGFSVPAPMVPKPKNTPKAKSNSDEDNLPE